jgi:hypothetical protein
MSGKTGVPSQERSKGRSKDLPFEDPRKGNRTAEGRGILPQKSGLLESQLKADE